MNTTNKILIAALAAMVLSSGLSTKTAIASGVALAPASALSAAAPPNVRLAAVVCGSVGCAPVSTKATPRRKLKWLGHG